MKRVGSSGFQKCSKRLTGRAAEFAEPNPGEQLAESPDIAVADESQNSAVSSEI